MDSQRFRTNRRPSNIPGDSPLSLSGQSIGFEQERPNPHDFDQLRHVQPRQMQRTPPVITRELNIHESPSPQTRSSNSSQSRYDLQGTSRPTTPRELRTEMAHHQAEMTLRKDLGGADRQYTESKLSLESTPNPPPSSAHGLSNEAANNNTQPEQAGEVVHTPAETAASQQNMPIVVATEDSAAGVNNTMEQKSEPPTVVVSRTCCVCTDVFTGDDDIKVQFPFTCGFCNQSNYCIKCIKDWFLDACKDESRMPPKCCSAIPLATITGHLSMAQVDLFKAKHEEWNTSNRLYCPVPSCSAFISPRLYIEGRKSTSAPSPPAELEVDSGREVALNPPTLISQSVATKSNVACPECHTLVCTSCRSFNHLGPCPQTDIEPELAAILEKWKIKRCPKCRTGLRKMYGCSHVECRCGAHFCYECLLPFTQCDGRCEGEEEYDPDDCEEDDLDGRTGYFDGDGHEIGEEPNPDIADIWGCDHGWNLVTKEDATTLLNPQQPECQNCFKALHFSGDDAGPSGSYHNEQVRKVMDGEDVVMGGTEDAGVKEDQQTWTCFCGHQTCLKCPREPPRNRTYNATWKWRCNCPEIDCLDCDRDEAKNAANVDLEVAWFCRCGKMLCGACKEEAKVDYY